MIPLATNLDTADFDSLVELGRSLLPALAPGWTDYNIHDPGIMQVELLAWLADSQIYSLARNRRNERLAMLRLFGRRARGATPARGVLFPETTPDYQQPLAADLAIKPARGGAPRLESDAAITLLPLTLASVATHNPGGIDDHTQLNARARASFEPFGPDGNGALHIGLAPVANAPPIVAEQGGDVRLSIGWRVAGGGVDAPISRHGRIAVFLADGSPLRPRRDTTFGLQRSGTMILALRPGQLDQTIILRPQAGYSLRPRIIAVGVNALPVEQRASFIKDEWHGNGRPGQTIDIEPAQLFAADEAMEDRIWQLLDGKTSLTVRSAAPGGWRDWLRGLLDEAEPENRIYALEEAPDGTRIRLRFGNGVNGMRPALDELIAISLRVSCGSDGNIAGETEWVVPFTAMRWRNPDPVTGGRPAQDPDTGLALLRAHLAEARPLATSAQIEAAVAGLKGAFGIDRAEILEGWERGRSRPAIPATRTLVVMAREVGSETGEWLAAIRRRIAPRLGIGERLLVVAPEYRRFTLMVAVTATKGSDRRALRDAIGMLLTERFDLSRSQWPLGRDVSAMVVAGWTRRLPGVANVDEVRFNGTQVDDGVLAIGPGELPLLDQAPHVTVDGGAS